MVVTVIVMAAVRRVCRHLVMLLLLLPRMMMMMILHVIFVGMHLVSCGTVDFVVVRQGSLESVVVVNCTAAN